MDNDRKSNASTCPHCGLVVRGSARVIHVRTCANKSPEDREHYRKHRQWPGPK